MPLYFQLCKFTFILFLFKLLNRRVVVGDVGCKEKMWSGTVFISSCLARSLISIVLYVPVACLPTDRAFFFNNKADTSAKRQSLFPLTNCVSGFSTWDPRGSVLLYLHKQGKRSMFSFVTQEFQCPTQSVRSTIRNYAWMMGLGGRQDSKSISIFKA